MIESFVHEWANLLIRWIHFIVGVAWIGASFYFNWLENNLERKPPQDEGIAGHLWAVHGGGFYHLKKFKTGPAELPAQLHWFKWEAYATWLSGITLLVVVYYFNASLFLIKPGLIDSGLIDSGLIDPGLINFGAMDMTPIKAIAIAVISVVGSWFVYDGLCRSPLRNNPLLLAATLVLYLSLLAYFLSEVFSGRGAYIHVGSAIGTMMVGNVFFVIIPAQKEMVAALKEQRRIDPAVGKNGLLRSTHNNYLTLPVLFLMISNHFPSAYGHSWSWLILIFVSLISVVVRHYFNVRKVVKSLWWILPAAFIAMLLVMWMTAPTPHKTMTAATPTAAVDMAQVTAIIQSRCVACHAAVPTQPGFAAPPAGLALETHAYITANAVRIATAVATRTMPIGNLTGMTDAERETVAAWYRALGDSATNAQ